jgi:hypothetical protein
MQHRQPRLGGIVDDYCPRERRLTNHAVVAMVGADIKQTRCTTCDAEHEYKQAKVPTIRRKKESTHALYKQALASAQPEALKAAESEQPGDAPPTGRVARPAEPPLEVEPEPPAAVAQEEPEAHAEPGDEDGSVHRRLIRATLPRAEGQVTQRPLPQFTVRQPNKFGDGNVRSGGGGGGGGRGPGGGSVGRARPTNVRGTFGRSGSRSEGSQGRSGGGHHQQPRAHHPGGRPMRHGKKPPK